MPAPLRYLAAACQTDFANPATRADIPDRVGHMLGMVDRAAIGYEPFGDVKLVTFPEFAHAAPIYLSVPELLDKLAVELPNEQTDRYIAKAKERRLFIQTGSFLEFDKKYPGRVFNTTCLIGPDGLLSKYRKVNPWIPWEVHSSPHDVPGYTEDLFPVTDTAIGKLGAAICYDWLFPEAIRELAFQGAEVLIRISAYMDPWGATSPMDWWTVVNRCRALENIAYVVASNQAASASHYPPFSWPGGSMAVDYDGRLLAQANPGPGEQIVIAPIDIGALRAERDRRAGHHMLGHHRAEAYPHARRPVYPGARPAGVLSIDGNNAAIAAGKKRAGCGEPGGPVSSR